MFGKKRKSAEKSVKKRSKKKAPEIIPKRIPGNPENRLFQARNDFFITKPTHQGPPRGTKIANSKKMKRFQK